MYTVPALEYSYSYTCTYVHASRVRTYSESVRALCVRSRKGDRYNQSINYCNVLTIYPPLGSRARTRCAGFACVQLVPRVGIIRATGNVTLLQLKSLAELATGKGAGHVRGT